MERVTTIDDPLLRAYLEGRGIPIDLARLYANEAHYRVGTRSFRAVAFPNNAKGYETRSPSFKGTLVAKDITTITGVAPEKRP